MLSLLYFKKKIKNLNLVFANTDFHLSSSLNLAKKNSKLLNLPLKILNIKLSDITKSNKKERCFYCKTEIFEKIKKEYPYYKIVDATNFSDTFDYRPGLKALENLRIISPFKDLKTTKRDILEFMKKNKKLENFISFPTTCYATRIDYNIPIEKKLLEILEKGENYLHKNGIKFCRLRLYRENVYAIETIEDYFPLITENIIENLKKFLKTEQINVKKYIFKSL